MTWMSGQGQVHDIEPCWGQLSSVRFFRVQEKAAKCDLQCIRWCKQMHWQAWRNCLGSSRLVAFAFYEVRIFHKPDLTPRMPEIDLVPVPSSYCDHYLS